MVAAIDQRTDPQTLWLRFDGTTAALYRAVDWQEVLALQHDGRLYRGESRFSLSDQLSTGRTVPNRVPPGASLPEEEELPAESVSYAERAAEILVGTPRVEAIQTDAYVANWDADVEIDGIVLSIAALDRFGHSLPVEGTVTV
ncbi:MAG: hypothetical protein GTO41_05005, partial [Burkholderiales bacterium]|nr:hypothetical protein [Burkholderiales bacterium]